MRFALNVFDARLATYTESLLPLRQRRSTFALRVVKLHMAWWSVKG